MGDRSRERRFIVSDHPAEIRSVVEHLAPADVHALEEGRVFVDGQRVGGNLRQVNPGSTVTWHAPRLEGDRYGDMEFRILDRRDNFVIVAKPAAWSSEPDRSGLRTSLRERVASLLRARDLHVATRLDTGVSGLVLIAVGESACRQAATWQELRQIQKDYLAIALGTLATDTSWSSSVDGKRAALTVSHHLGNSGFARFGSPSEIGASLLQVTPLTGRHHQIRVHAAACGHPLLGDRRYGGPTQYVKSDGTVRTVSRPMLHAWRIRIPWTDQGWTTVCPAPDDMRKLWADLDGVNCWPQS
jgi:23S rRNA-/tRNA-specific pseudouridylate synthase